MMKKQTREAGAPYRFFLFVAFRALQFTQYIGKLSHRIGHGISFRFRLCREEPL